MLLTLGPVSATRMLMQLAVAGQLGCQLFVMFAYKFLPIGTLFQSFFDDCACRRLRWRQWENCKVVDASKTRQQFSIMLVVPAGKRGGGNITAADASCKQAAGSEQLAVELCFPSKCFGCLQATEVEAMAKLQVPHAMKPQAVTNLLWSFASLRYYPAKLLDFLVSKPLASHMQQHSPAGAWSTPARGRVALRSAIPGCNVVSHTSELGFRCASKQTRRARLTAATGAAWLAAACISRLLVLIKHSCWHS